MKNGDVMKFDSSLAFQMQMFISHKLNTISSGQIKILVYIMKILNVEGFVPLMILEYITHYLLNRADLIIRCLITSIKCLATLAL